MYRQQHEYYISATSNNGKTITKPMTASQGGYFTFTEAPGMAVDSTMFDFDTTHMPMESITFTFGQSWTSVDDAEPLAIDPQAAEQLFGQFYPNPATTAATVRIDLNDGADYDVTIIDATGRTVHTSHINAAGEIAFSIRTDRFAAGQYTVVFSNDNRRIVRKLIVK